MCNTRGSPVYADLQILLLKYFSTLLPLSAIAMATCSTTPRFKLIYYDFDFKRNLMRPREEVGQEMLLLS